MKAEEREKKRDSRRELAEILFDTPSHVTDPAFNAVIEWMLKREAAARAEEQEANCKATCVCCENGDPLIQPKYQGGVLEHEVTTLDNKRLLVRCRAEAIRARSNA